MDEVKASTHFLLLVSYSPILILWRGITLLCLFGEQEILTPNFPFTIARNLTAEFEQEDESDEQSGYEGIYEEDEDDEEAINVEDKGYEEAINVEDEGDDIVVNEAINEEVEGDEKDINEESENGKRAENENEDTKEDEKDLEFYDSTYE
ncbi:PREDICTED: acidic leucine-rich nuclear phosphoprotein 32 family member A-like [Prunus mume]|uniref:Acidic leucine-rich nuclear phosphoprotein 32 family member A-like n=1 Tax=Prunus mume TaxID=102107 RepID=A0ABM0NA82_PRUMU|nr:PREDICTED: acidic leucine-rich nuclear phosphoprotein 32 family member A-like [Prunus mume]